MRSRLIKVYRRKIKTVGMAIEKCRFVFNVFFSRIHSFELNSAKKTHHSFVWNWEKYFAWYYLFGFSKTVGTCQWMPIFVRHMTMQNTRFFYIVCGIQKMYSSRFSDPLLWPFFCWYVFFYYVPFENQTYDADTNGHGQIESFCFSLSLSLFLFAFFLSLFAYCPTDQFHYCRSSFRK